MKKSSCYLEEDPATNLPMQDTWGKVPSMSLSREKSSHLPQHLKSWLAYKQLGHRRGTQE
jgi:hypothetical protein